MRPRWDHPSRRRASAAPQDEGERSVANSHRLLRPAAEIIDQAHLAARLARQTGVAAMQDQPVMGVQHEFGWDHALEFEFDLKRGTAWRQPRAIADAKHM